MGAEEVVVGVLTVKLINVKQHMVRLYKHVVMGITNSKYIFMNSICMVPYK